MKIKPCSEIHPNGWEYDLEEGHKMDPELKARWVAALRSGKYEQGVGGLKHNDKYCCLGVLRMVMGGECRENETLLTEKETEELWETTNLNDVKVKIGGILASLVNHNDDGRTFAEIADAIEEQLKKPGGDNGIK